MSSRAQSDYVPIVRRFRDLEALSAAAAQALAAFAEQTVAARGRFLLLLSGGSTPLSLYRKLIAPPYRDRDFWKQTHFFWGDERAVPPDHPESTFGAARATLLEPLGISPEQIHPIRAEPDLERAARAYEQEIARVLETDAEPPRFDLDLLGMGPDGHTASLFPGSPTLEATRPVVADPTRSPARITLTLPILNAAWCTFFLVSGAEKAAALAHVLQGSSTAEPLPAQRIQPVSGQLVWFVDEAAASQLTSSSGETHA